MCACNKMLQDTLDWQPTALLRAFACILLERLHETVAAKAELGV